jgi:hypothetical protein
MSNPIRNRLAGFLGDLELNRPSSLLLKDDCPGINRVTARDVGHAQFE